MEQKKRFQKESLDGRRKRVLEILSIFRKEYPHAKCHLDFNSPFELLISCILSAQCTDVLVNKVTKGLYKKYRSPADFAKADLETLQEEIHSVTFYRNKSKSVIKTSAMLDEKYGGEVPPDMDKLTELAGVGRKTANVVLGNAFGIPGIIIDTHTKRLSNRLALSPKTDPEKIEYDLMKLVPKEQWTYFSNSLGDHGREVCKARKPQCKICKINHLCPSAQL